MVLLPGSSISTSAAKEIEANNNRRNQRRQQQRQDSDLESNQGTPPPPYRLPVPGVDYETSLTTSNQSISEQARAHQYLSNHRQYNQVQRNEQTGQPSTVLGQFSTQPNLVHHHTNSTSQEVRNQEIMHPCGNRSMRTFGVRGCRRGRGMGGKNRCRKHKRKLFRKVLARFTIFFTLTMLWLHSETISQSLQKAFAALPQPIMTLLNVIGHILYLPISFSQTFGVLLYCALAAFLLTAMHVKLRKRRMARWQTSLHEALRARVNNGPPEHDQEAWPESSHGHDHHSDHIRHGLDHSYKSDRRVHFNAASEQTTHLVEGEDEESFEEDEKSSTTSSI